MTPEMYVSESKRTCAMNYGNIRDRLNGWTETEGGVMSLPIGANTRLKIDLIHAAMGVVTESAELLDMLKKHIFYGKPIDTVNIVEECGDILWYIAIICRTYNVSFEQLMDTNIEKLKKRYPDKFTEDAALTRNVEKELSHIKPICPAP